MLKPSGPYFLLSKATPWNKHNEKSRFLNSSVCKIKKKWILFYCWKLWFIAKNLLPNMVTGEMAFRLSISSWYSLLMLSSHTKNLSFSGVKKLVKSEGDPIICFTRLQILSLWSISSPGTVIHLSLLQITHKTSRKRLIVKGNPYHQKTLKNTCK